jgi:hypothetical protein
MPYQFIDGGGRLIELDDDDPVPVSSASIMRSGRR